MSLTSTPAAVERSRATNSRRAESGNCPPYRIPVYPTHPGPDDPGALAAWRRDLADWLAELDELSRDAAWRDWHHRTRGRPRPPAVPHPRNDHDAARERWEALYDAHARVLRTGSARPWELPEPLAPENLRRLVATLLDRRSRAPLRELLLDLLVDDIADIALAVGREVAR